MLCVDDLALAGSSSDAGRRGFVGGCTVVPGFSGVGDAPKAPAINMGSVSMLKNVVVRYFMA